MFLGESQPFPEDKVGQRLRDRGIAVLDYKATDSPYDREVLAKKFVIGDAEIVYNYDGSDTSTLIICFYRLLNRKVGLCNAFAESMWFLDFLKSEDVGVQRVMCTIKMPDTQYGKTLPSAKMIRFCTDLMGGSIIPGAKLVPWYILELKDYTGLRLSGRKQSMPLEASVSKKIH